MFDRLLPLVESIPDTTRDDIQSLADDLKDHAFMPVIGAGGSVGCGSVSAGVLAEELYSKVTSNLIELNEPPRDLSDLSQNLGKMADAICLEHPAERVLEGLEFGDKVRWPSSQDVFESFKTVAHACAYRVLARMAKERLLAEGVTFNYDCHYGGVC